MSIINVYTYLFFLSIDLQRLIIMLLVGSSVISPPNFSSPSGASLFSGLTTNAGQQASSSGGLGTATSGFGAAPLFGSGTGMGSSSFGSPPQLGGQTAPMGGR